MVTFTKFSRKLGKRERKGRRKFSKTIGRSLTKRRTGKRSIFDL